MTQTLNPSPLSIQYGIGQWVAQKPVLVAGGFVAPKNAVVGDYTAYLLASPLELAAGIPAAAEQPLMPTSAYAAAWAGSLTSVAYGVSSQPAGTITFGNPPAQSPAATSEYSAWLNPATGVLSTNAPSNTPTNEFMW